MIKRPKKKKKVVVVGKAWSAWISWNGAERMAELLQIGASRAQAEILKDRSWTALSRWAKMKIKNAMEKEVTQ